MSAARDALTEQLKEAIRDPKLVALTLAKSSLAEERGVQLRIAADCHVDADLTDITAVLTVTGNLIDNAIEATAQAPGPRWVELTVVSAGENLLIRVRDSGPGVPDDMREAIFTDGFTSKSSPTGARRGLGLALVRQITERRGGMVSVGPGRRRGVHGGAPRLPRRGRRERTGAVCGLCGSGHVGADTAALPAGQATP